MGEDDLRQENARFDGETELVIDGGHYKVNRGFAHKSYQDARENTKEQHTPRKSRRGRKRNSSPIGSSIEEDNQSSISNVTKAQQLEGITTPRPEWDTEDDTDTILTEDEMSVNTINKNKAKLFSHILNPKNKGKLKEKDLITNKGRHDDSTEENKSKITNNVQN